MSDRRSAMKLAGLALGGASPLFRAAASAAPAAAGPEGQRRADQGNGTYRNPILAGDYADPSVLKDGDDYYLTHSSFDTAPGLLLWHSRDLVNWQPLGPVLDEPLGTVFAVDLVKHQGRYFIYIPFMRAPWSTNLASFANIYVIHADDIRGPWSTPIDLGIGGRIDPGHAVGEDGKRYLFLSGVERVQLGDDGLSTVGKPHNVYEGWRYPDEWITEAFALEGPKHFTRNGWHYLVSAQGGTGGPATGHMVIVARSRSIDGPWENCPYNPIVRSKSDAEHWLSRGHATLLEGPAGDWWMVYHGYENGFRTLGRQTLLEPIRWTREGWPLALGGDLSRALAMPKGGHRVPHGLARSDDFRALALGIRWSFAGAGPADRKRARIEDGTLVLSAKGSGPHNCAPLAQNAGDRAYEVSVAMELDGTAEGGLLLFFNDRLFLGMGHNGTRMVTYRGGKASYWPEPAPATRRIDLKIVNDRNIVTMFYRVPGLPWTRHAVRNEVSGYHANTADDLASLRPALFAAGEGAVRFRDFRYRALA